MLELSGIGVLTAPAAGAISLRRFSRPLEALAGGVMTLMGIAMITGQPSAIAYWLSETFPLLANIG